MHKTILQYSTFLLFSLCLLSPATHAGMMCPPRPCPPAPCPVISIQSPESNPVRRLKIFITNDVHGHIRENPDKGRIGYALLKGRIDDARADGWETFLLDAGDAISGSAIAQFDSGQSIAELIGLMGYRAVAPGNHEFDYNASENNPLYYPEVILGKISASSPGVVEATCLNLSYRGDDVPGIQRGPLVLHDGSGPGGDGLRLVVAGVLTPYVATVTNRAGLAEYDFGLIEKDGTPDHAATKRNVINMVATAVAPYDRPGDIVLLLSHLGWKENDADYADGQISGRDLALVPNVDMVVDSHSHNVQLPERIGDAHYGNAGRYLENFIEIDIVADGKNVDAAFTLKNRADLQNQTPSEQVARKVTETEAAMGMDRRLFQNTHPELTGDEGLTSGNTPLGRFLCRSMLEITHADLALYNSGGIRSGLPAGWITVGSVYDMIPFQNNLVTWSMTGNEILTMFNTLPAFGTNGFPQFHGMTVYGWKETTPAGTFLRAAGILDRNGRPLTPGRTYAVALNSFMAGGGDGYSYDPAGQLKDYGDAATVINRHFGGAADPGFEALRTNNTLLLFPTREDAEDAFEAAGEESPDAAKSAA